MKRAAVFFDRDNTLIANDGYLGEAAGVKLIDGAAQAVARAHALGFAVITVSNQSGVAKGLFPEEAVHAVNARLDELLAQGDPQATIDRHEFCPFHPEAAVERYRLDSDLRKPKPGMILRATKMLDLDLPRSWMIGDAPRDIAAGQAAGCRTILLRLPDVDPSPAASAEMATPPEVTATTLAKALDYIAAHAPANPPSAESAAAESESSPSQMPPTPGAAIGATAPGVATRATAAGAAIGATAPGASTRATAADTTIGATASGAAIGATATETIAADTRAADSTAAGARASISSSQLERIAEQILQELHRRNTRGTVDFSVSKLLAGVSQAMALAALVGSYFLRDRTQVEPCLLVALTLQTLTLTLLLMGREA